MRKTLFSSIIAGSMALLLMTACADDSKDAQATVTDQANNAIVQDNSIMDQPVDFSTPENVEKSLQKVKEQQGVKAYKTLDNAMQYIMVYDLNISNNKEKLYKKLDGKTPNEIIAKMKKR